MTFTAEIPTRLFRVDGFKGLKFSVSKKVERMCDGSDKFQATCYGSGNDGRFFKAVGDSREAALESLLGKVR